MASKLKVETFSWNYSASGHGKGAADEVGGCIKRTADSLIAQGKDINTFEKLHQGLMDNCTGIKILKVNEDFGRIQSYIDYNIVPFRGTFNVHQLTWSKKHRNSLYARSLSCSECDLGEECTRYNIEVIMVGEPYRILFIKWH